MFKFCSEFDHTLGNLLLQTSHLKPLTVTGWCQKNHSKMRNKILFGLLKWKHFQDMCPLSKYQKVGFGLRWRITSSLRSVRMVSDLARYFLRKTV